jgi:hypothetical protein
MKEPDAIEVREPYTAEMTHLHEVKKSEHAAMPVGPFDIAGTIYKLTATMCQLAASTLQ